MNKETRKVLCKKCLKAVREVEKNYLRKYRLEVKQRSPQVSGKIKLKKQNNAKTNESTNSANPPR